MRLKGKAHKYGSNVDTDVIIPARYLNTSDPDELASHCMEDLDPDFLQKARPGDVIVAEENFGCGSSREHAPLAIKTAGISCVIAKTFARIFYRNSINIGLPILQCPEAVDGIRAGDEVEVDTASGQITNLTTGKSFQAMPFPDFMQKLIASGGLIAYARERISSGLGPACDRSTGCCR
jgi:3-isopropylmalate/(R)-2-methylmalate dehydratase small subunit